MIKKQKIFSALFLILLLFIMSLFFEFKEQESLFVYYLNVGQGDSILIKSPNGKKILIDGGRDNKVVKELEKVLPFYDKQIDILILSHDDLDHIGGFFDVIKKYNVKKILRSNAQITSEYEKELLSQTQKSNIEVKNISWGDKIIIDSKNEIYLDVLWPNNMENLTNENTNSLVLELIHGENEFLFTGDATIETELFIIKEFGDKIDSDVLKVGHHGSKTSTSQIFLEKVTPDYSILSYGENSYGHPHQEVFDKLEKFGGEIFQTNERATIVARSNGENLEVNYLNESPNNLWLNIFYNLISQIKQSRSKI